MTTYPETRIDYITGRRVVDIGAEANRQQMERVLVEEKGYSKQAVEVDAPIFLQIEDGRYRSTIDLVVRVGGWRYMAILCAAGSLASREREVIAAARLLDDYQIPLAVACDGRTALVWDTISGKRIGQGLAAIPTKAQAEAGFDPQRLLPLAEARRARQMLIFRSYDTMNVHKGAGNQ
ncbi:MAG: hypothetical protein HKP58_13665 [Desulfatitalea sp.]|nr:type I restriction enzyme HsdR N-terminal domain-containing protein [Desulfatitalea sp.]NNK01449.1 hypothetical protein [Desulfatitalea sp.]